MRVFIMSKIPKTIQDNLKNDVLESLQLNSKNLNDADAFELATMIKDKKKLKEINLSYNNFSIEGIKQLAQAIETTQITTLRLNTIHLHDEGAEILFQSLCKIPTLSYVSLWCNDITDNSSHLLADFIKNHHAIKEIDLFGNKLTDQGIHIIFDALDSNHSVEKINLAENPFNVSNSNHIIQRIFNSIKSKNYSLSVGLNSKCSFMLELLIKELRQAKEQASHYDAFFKRLQKGYETQASQIEKCTNKSTITYSSMNTVDGNEVQDNQAHQPSKLSFFM